MFAPGILNIDSNSTKLNMITAELRAKVRTHDLDLEDW
jgi:hypothetical protein